MRIPPFTKIHLGARPGGSRRVPRELFYPAWSIVTWHFPAKGNNPAVAMKLYDGGKLPKCGLTGGLTEHRDNGRLLGDRAGMLGGSHASNPSLSRSRCMRATKYPPRRSLARRDTALSGCALPSPANRRTQRAASGIRTVHRGASGSPPQTLGGSLAGAFREGLPALLLESGHAFRATGVDSSAGRRGLPGSGRPVPSKEVAERPEVEWGPSTVRAELAVLEAAGLPDPPAHLGRAGADRLRLPPLRRLMMASERAGRAEGRARARRACAARSTRRCGRRPRRWPRSPTWWRWRAPRAGPERRRSTGSRCCSCSRTRSW